MKICPKVKVNFFVNLSAEIKFHKMGTRRFGECKSSNIFLRSLPSRLELCTEPLAVSSQKIRPELWNYARTYNRHQGSTLGSQLPAIFANFRRKNWRVFKKYNVMMKLCKNSNILSKNAIFSTKNWRKYFQNHNIGPGSWLFCTFFRENSTEFSWEIRQKMNWTLNRITRTRQI
jgi:hypothetical protein